MSKTLKALERAAMLCWKYESVLPKYASRRKVNLMQACARHAAAKRKGRKP